MSSHAHKKPFLEEHWGFLLISFGILFVACLLLYNPHA